MSSTTAAARHLLALCGLIPLSQLTQEEVDYVFRRAVEDAPGDDLSVADGASDEPRT